MRYLIAYDVCCPRRLRRVARRLEQQAMRTQKSVFAAELSPRQLTNVLNDVRPLVDTSVDLVQAWQLASTETLDGVTLGDHLPLASDAVVIQSQSRFWSKGTRR